MPNWIAITKQALYDSKAAAFIDAADAVQLGAGQAGRSADAIADVVAEIRRKIARCHALDQDPAKIPAGLKTLAVDLVVARLKIALEQDLTEDEKRGLDRHERELNRIADGKDLVDPPDNPVSPGMNQAQASAQYQARPRLFTGRELSGL
jgi:hypothetical protein